MILTRVKRENINIQIYKWIEPTHTLNPPQIQDEKFKSTEFASGNLLKRGFSSTTRNWIACTTNLYHQIRRNTFPSREWFLPTIVPLIIGGTAYNELIRDNYRRVKGQWVGKKKWPKKKPRRTITTQTISMAFADPPNSSDSDSSESEFYDIDEFEYDADGHAIFPFLGMPVSPSS